MGFLNSQDDVNPTDAPLGTQSSLLLRRLILGTVSNRENILVDIFLVMTFNLKINN